MSATYSILPDVNFIGPAILLTSGMQVDEGSFFYWQQEKIDWEEQQFDIVSEQCSGGRRVSSPGPSLSTAAQGNVVSARQESGYAVVNVGHLPVVISYYYQ